MTADLLPKNSTEFERAFSLASDTLTLTDPNVSAMRGIKIGNPPPSFLPYLVYEYGLGELTPYLPNLYELIDEGIDWQRIRGTPAAVDLALSWVGYAATIEEPAARRRRWNLFMLEMDRLRDAENDLIRIEGVTQLSVAVRSVFWRGFNGYDVRALEYGGSRWGETIWSDFSGVRVDGGRVKWSYGRSYGIDHTMTELELVALGVWLEPAVGSEPLSWGAFPWPAAPWQSTAALARSVAMLEAVTLDNAWLVFKDADDDVVGYRRARALHPVRSSPSGAYRVGTSRFDVEPAGATVLLVEALTGFGDGYGATAESVGVILNGVPTSEHSPGALWLPETGLSYAGPILAEQALQIEFGRTVRERVSVALRF